jgi:hypothetical protein
MQKGLLGIGRASLFAWTAGSKPVPSFIFSDIEHIGLWFPHAVAERLRQAGPAIATARSSRHIIGRQISPVWFL